VWHGADAGPQGPHRAAEPRPCPANRRGETSGEGSTTFSTLARGCLLPEPVAWPRVPLLTLLHDGHLLLDAVVFCVGPCEGGPSRKLASAPPAGIDRVDTLRRMDLSPLGLWAQLDDPLAFSECARHVLLLRAEDAMLATYCDDDVAGARPPRLRDYQLDEMARARVLPAVPRADASVFVSPRQQLEAERRAAGLVP